MYVSEINAIMRAHRIDALITMNDLLACSLSTSRSYRPRSVGVALEPSPPRPALEHTRCHAYDRGGVVAPGDASRGVGAGDAKEVRAVPHGIDVARGRRSSSCARAHAPADAFVVAVTFANYDGENRKNVTSRASPFARCATR